MTRQGSAASTDSAKKSKSAQLTIHKEQMLAPAGPVPPGSVFKGHREFIVQDLHIAPHNTRYLRECWLTPDGCMLMGAFPPGVGGSHFGTDVLAFVLYLHHHCHVTQPKLAQMLRELGPRYPNRTN